MNQPTWSGAAVSGVIAVVVGEIATYVISLLIPSTRNCLNEMLIAVGLASFFAGFAGYLAGARRTLLR